MTKLNLKYTAMKVDEIEQSKNLPIENCIADTTIGNLCLFIQKGLIDDNGIHGVSRAVAMSKLEEYLEEHDKDELLMDIMEALIKAGFLSREIDLEKMRKMKTSRAKELNAKMDEVI